MPLEGANRPLVRDGLRLINKGRTVPGFSIGPVINAPGRLYDDGASSVLDVLAADWKDYCLPWKCDKLLEANEERKKQVREALDSLNFQKTSQNSLVLFNPDLGEGIVGLIAGKLCEIKRFWTFYTWYSFKRCIGSYSKNINDWIWWARRSRWAFHKGSGF